MVFLLKLYNPVYWFDLSVLRAAALPVFSVFEFKDKALCPGR